MKPGHAMTLPPAFHDVDYGKDCSVKSTQLLTDTLCRFILSASTDHSASWPNLEPPGKPDENSL